MGETPIDLGLVLDMHTRLLQDLQQATTKTIVIVGEQHESKQSADCNILLLKKITEIANSEKFSLPVIFELTQGIVDRINTSTLTAQVLALVNHWKGKIVPGLDRIYSNAESTDIEKSIASAALSSMSSSASKIEVVICGINHVSSIKEIIANSDKDNPPNVITIDHCFIDPEYLSATQKLMLNAEQSACDYTLSKPKKRFTP